MTQFITYAVYRNGDIEAAGTLLECWTYVFRRYNENNSMHPFDLADIGVYVAPVGDHHKKASPKIKCPRCDSAELRDNGDWSNYKCTVCDAWFDVKKID